MKKITKSVKKKKYIYFNRSDLDNIEENETILGLLLCNSNPIFTKSQKSSKKIYLNSSGILLKNKKYFDTFKTDQQININFIKNKVNETYGYKNKNIISIISLYNKRKIKFYLIRVNLKLDIKDYEWIHRLEMFKLNPEEEYDDIYENIIKYNKNYLNDKTFMTNNYLNSFIKLEKIYRALIGEEIINHAEDRSEFSKSSKS